MSVTNHNWPRRTDRTLADPGSAFPDGDASYQTPKGITNLGWPRHTKRLHGVEAHGATSASGEIRIIYNNLIVASGGAGDHYQVVGLPPGPTSGDNYSDRAGGISVEMKTESGGIATKSLGNSGAHHFSPEFGTLTIEVQDANGDPVPKAEFWVGTRKYVTKTDGSESLPASGTVTVKALDAAVETDVTVNASQDGSHTFQYHGVEGKIRTPTGGPIANADVKLKLGDDVYSQTTSNDDGTYQIPLVPPDGYSATVESGEFSRDFESGLAGQYSTKNLPFDLEKIGGVELDLRDATSGDPIAGLPGRLRDAVLSALSADGGELALIQVLQDKNTTKEVEVVIGEEDPRYQTRTLTVSMVAGDSVSATVDLQRQVAVVNA